MSMWYYDTASVDVVDAEEGLTMQPVLRRLRQRYPDHARLVEDAVRRIRTAVAEAADSEFAGVLLPQQVALDATHQGSENRT